MLGNLLTLKTSVRFLSGGELGQRKNENKSRENSEGKKKKWGISKETRDERHQ